MSLSEAVLAIADEMEGEIENRLLLSYAKQLRIAVKASGGSDRPAPAVEDPTIAWKAAARREFAQKGESESRSVEVVGLPGSDDMPTYANIAGDMPFNAKTFVQGCVCILAEDGRLHYSEAETAAIKHQRAGGVLLGK